MPKFPRRAAKGLAEQASLPEQVDPPTPVPAPVGIEEQRARARLLSAGPDALADHELLEMALLPALPRRATKPIARRLLTVFGSVTGAVAAPIGELSRIEGLGDAGIAALKMIQGIALRLTRAEILDRPVLSNWVALMNYLQAVMARERVEQFRILFLDHRNRLITDEVQTRGTVNHTPVFPREVLRRALELNASALILAHNHPSGDPAPSLADIQMTLEVADALRPINILLHDHVIVGNGAWLSLRREGLLGG